MLTKISNNFTTKHQRSQHISLLNTKRTEETARHCIQKQFIYSLVDKDSLGRNRIDSLV